MKQKALLQTMGFIVIPSIYFFAYWVIGWLKGPFYWSPNQDPDYHYLGNSLNIANLFVPQHIDHPGTPLQVLGGGILRVTYGLKAIFTPDLASLSEDVLSHPEFYLNLLSCALLVLTTLLLFIVGVVAFRVSHNIFLALTLQLTPLIGIFSIVGLEPSRVAPEALLFCYSQLLVLILLHYLYQDQGARSRWLPISLGTLLGVGLATKVSFLPMLIFVLLVQGLSRKIMTVGMVVVSFFVATLPIISQYPRLFGWLFRIATHEGGYGSGKEGLVELPKFLKRIGVVAAHNSIFWWLVVLLTVVCIASWFVGRSRRWQVTSIDRQLSFQHVWQVTGVTVLAVWAQVALLAIEGTQTRHLTTVLGLMGWMIFLLVQLIGSLLLTVRPTLTEPSRGYRVGGAIALFLSLVISIQQTDVTIALIEDGAAERQQDLEKIAQIYEQPEYRSCFRTFHPRASRVESALEQSNRMAGSHYSTILTQLYPQATFYRIVQRKASYYDTYNARKIDPTPLFQQGNGCILMQTNSIAVTRKQLKRTKGVTPLYLGEAESLYKIEPVSP